MSIILEDLGSVVKGQKFFSPEKQTNMENNIGRCSFCQQTG